MCCGVKFAGRLIFAGATLFGGVWRDVMIERVYCLFINIRDTLAPGFMRQLEVREKAKHVERKFVRVIDNSR
jgi:hypothetical protein